MKNRRETPRRSPSSPTRIGAILGELGPLTPLLPPGPPSAASAGSAARHYDPDVAAALVPPAAPLERSSMEVRRRRAVARRLEQLIQRAIWRAERRSRRVPWHVRCGLSWVMAERRRIAFELMRALTSLGAGDRLARRLAELAALRFPRDGIVVDDRRRGPRLEGTNPRAVGENPRAIGANPRATGTSPRQQRARGRYAGDPGTPLAGPWEEDARIIAAVHGVRE